MTESLTHDEMLPTRNRSWTDVDGEQHADVSTIDDTAVEPMTKAPETEGPAVHGSAADDAPTGTSGPMPEGPDVPVQPIQPVSLPDLPANGHAGEVRDLRLLADVRVEVTIEMGRVRLPLRDLLRLAPGAVLELDRAVDDAVDVLVNGTPVARGEVFVVDGDFGVRITEILGRR